MAELRLHHVIRCPPGVMHTFKHPYKEGAGVVVVRVFVALVTMVSISLWKLFALLHRSVPDCNDNNYTLVAFELCLPLVKLQTAIIIRVEEYVLLCPLWFPTLPVLFNYQQPSLRCIWNLMVVGQSGCQSVLQK